VLGSASEMAGQLESVTAVTALRVKNITGVLAVEATLRSRGAAADIVAIPLGAEVESEAVTVPLPDTVTVLAMFETVGSVIVCGLELSDC
jgi:hypothetical protein